MEEKYYSLTEAFNQVQKQTVFTVINDMGYEGKDLIGIYSSKEKANKALYDFLVSCYGSRQHQWTKSSYDGMDQYRHDPYTTMFVSQEEVQ